MLPDIDEDQLVDDLEQFRAGFSPFSSLLMFTSSCTTDSTINFCKGVRYEKLVVCPRQENRDFVITNVSQRAQAFFVKASEANPSSDLWTQILSPLVSKLIYLFDFEFMDFHMTEELWQVLTKAVLYSIQTRLANMPDRNQD
jgi:hypothetical protein